jgi:hypothetical protein
MIISLQVATRSIWGRIMEIQISPNGPGNYVISGDEACHARSLSPTL